MQFRASLQLEGKTATGIAVGEQAGLSAADEVDVELELADAPGERELR